MGLCGGAPFPPFPLPLLLRRYIGHPKALSENIVLVLFALLLKGVHFLAFFVCLVGKLKVDNAAQLGAAANTFS